MGAVLVVGGIAAFIEAHAHLPEYGSNTHRVVEVAIGESGPHELLRGHLSRTRYDLLVIGAWALAIFGALLVVVGLIGYWGAQTRSDAARP